jgi:hypothetical protein
MKFASILAVAFCVVVVVSAAPCEKDHDHHGDSSHNDEDNSNHENKQINQSIGTVGGSSNGILGGLLSGGILSKTENNNYVSQNAKIN